jgi:hypothetical protein
LDDLVLFQKLSPDLITALCLPQTFSSADEISPRVALRLAASIDNSNMLPSPLSAHFVNVSNAF